jgi:hypothetical protein
LFQLLRFLVLRSSSAIFFVAQASRLALHSQQGATSVSSQHVTQVWLMGSIC